MKFSSILLLRLLESRMQEVKDGYWANSSKGWSGGIPPELNERGHRRNQSLNRWL